MNKSELYYKAIDKKTGQGIAMTIMPSDVNEIIEELVKDGLMKTVDIRFRTLPDDKFACLTNVYCVEEDTEPDALTYMRIYVGLEKVVDLGRVSQLTLLDAIKDPEVMSGYTKWLKKNHKELIKVKNLDNVEVKGTELSEEEISYLKSRGWYEKNLTVGESLSKLEEANSLIRKEISMTNELIGLMKGNKKYTGQIAEHKNNIDKLEKELIYRKNIKSFLSNYNKDEKIQNII